MKCFSHVSTEFNNKSLKIFIQYFRLNKDFNMIFNCSMPLKSILYTGCHKNIFIKIFINILCNNKFYNRKLDFPFILILKFCILN